MIAVTATETPIPALAPFDSPSDLGFGGLNVGIDADDTVVDVVVPARSVVRALVVNVRKLDLTVSTRTVKAPDSVVRVRTEATAVGIKLPNMVVL